MNSSESKHIHILGEYSECYSKVFNEIFIANCIQESEKISVEMNEIPQ